MTPIYWLLKLGFIWLSIDVVVLATGWYLVKTIRPYFPHWWQQVIADDWPSDEEVQLDEVEQPMNLVET
jgi:hypothetical protein